MCVGGNGRHTSSEVIWRGRRDLPYTLHFLSLILRFSPNFLVSLKFSFFTTLATFVFCHYPYSSFLHSLPSQGFRVFAGCLDANGEGAAALKRHGSARLVVLQMDVTNQEQLAKAAQEVKKLLSEGG